MGSPGIYRRLSIALSGAEVAIVVKDGKAKLQRGKVLPGLISALTDVAADQGVATGLILAYRKPPGHRITISREFPPRSHQVIRNVWGAFAK